MHDYSCKLFKRHKNTENDTWMSSLPVLIVNTENTIQIGLGTCVFLVL